MSTPHSQDGYARVRTLYVEPGTYHFTTPEGRRISLFPPRIPPERPSWEQMRPIIAKRYGRNPPSRIPRQRSRPPSTFSQPRDTGKHPKNRGTWDDCCVVGTAVFCLGTCLWIPLSVCVGLVTRCCRGLEGLAPGAEDTEWIRAMKQGIHI